jgi:long-chain acyl-CoA synthetase
MREFSVPAAVKVEADANLADAVWENAVRHPGDTTFRRRVDGQWHDVTALGFRDEVRAVAKGLVASGVRPGDRVGLMSRTRYEWTLVDFAIWAAGAVTVPVYDSSSAEQLSWIMSDSGAVALVVESPANQALIDALRPDLPELREVWQFDAGGIDMLVSAGRELADEEIERTRRLRRADDLATIIYTSGTTGRPKGCELTHRNMLTNVHNSIPGLGRLFHPGESTLLFLPLAHSFARLIQNGAVISRTTLGHSPDLKNVLPELAEFKPTFILSVPRVFEKIYNGAKQKAHAGGKGAIFDRAEAVAVAYSEALEHGGPSLMLRAEHALFARLVYGKILAALGGRCQGAISGGAALGARLAHFFRGVGLPIYEGYGLTETAPASTVNLIDSVRVGTVGRPLPGVSIRIAEDGEILIKGDHIFIGYWKNPAATAEVLDLDGWFHSGDLGRLDHDGFLSITGRKKEILVTAAGKNVAPAVLEDRIRSNVLVSQCMVVGDGKPFISALITLDPEGLPDWLARNGKAATIHPAELQDDPDVLAEIQRAIDDANKAVSRAEAVKKFRILPRDFTEAGGELTPSLKLKRNVVMKEYAEDVSALYD